MRAWNLGWLCAVALGLTPAVGCGDSEGGSSGPTLEETGAMLVDAYCDLFTSCMPAVFAEQYFGSGGCEARLQANLDDGELLGIQEAIDTGRVTYDGAKVDDCFAAVSALGCGIETARVFNEGSCAEVFVGTVDEGGGCVVDVDCAGNNFCDRSAGCPGTCSAPRTEGGDCEDDDDCVEGLACANDTGKCVARATEGQACGGGVQEDCALGLTCAGDDDETQTPGLCKKNEDVFAGALGDPCDLSATELCEDGLSCVVTSLDGNGATFACAEAVASGAACSLGIPDPCPTGEYCDGIDPNTGDVDGTCTALPGVGDPCVESFGGQCQPGLVCGDDNHCWGVGRIGASCSGDESCASENCAGGTCAAPATCVL